MAITEPDSPQGIQTVVYASPGGHNLRMDFWVPADVRGALPVLVYFHGGGVVAASRKHERTIWVPLQELCMQHGVIFISSDYRLLCPSTGLDIAEDVKALFAYLAKDLTAKLPAGCEVATNCIITSGCSGGGYVSRLAAVHAIPRPAAQINIFGMGAQTLSDTLVLGRKRVPPYSLEPAKEYLKNDPQVISEDTEVGLSLRMRLVTYLLNEAKYLDYLLACPGISRKLAHLSYEARVEALPASAKPAVPELYIDASYPPTAFVHGDIDTLVSLQDSQQDYARLISQGVPSELQIVKNAEHMFFNEWPPGQNTCIVPSSVDSVEKAFNFALSHLPMR